jgi:predicted nucleic acid-binding protein
LRASDILNCCASFFKKFILPMKFPREVVVRGAGRPAAELVAKAACIETHTAASIDEVLQLRSRYSLGRGELATVLLARSLPANLIIVDDRAARKLAKTGGLNVIGSVGVLDTSHRGGIITDLGETYKQLLAQGIYIDIQILNRSLTLCGLQNL